MFDIVIRCDLLICVSINVYIYLQCYILHLVIGFGGIQFII